VLHEGVRASESANQTGRRAAEQAVAPDAGPRSLRSLGPSKVNGSVMPMRQPTGPMADMPRHTTPETGPSPGTRSKCIGKW
jgi:hypothetical protein